MLGASLSQLLLLLLLHVVDTEVEQSPGPACGVSSYLVLLLLMPLAVLVCQDTVPLEITNLAIIAKRASELEAIGHMVEAEI